MKRNYGKILILLVLAVCVMWSRTPANAAVSDVQVTNQNTTLANVAVGDTGRIIPAPGELKDYAGMPVTVSRWVYSSYNEEIVTVDMNGNYQAVTYGQASVAVYGYTEAGEIVFTGYCRFTVSVDMTNVTLAKNSISGYTATYYSFMDTIAINSPVVLNGENSEMTYQVDNPEMSVNCYLENNEIRIDTDSEGSTRIQITINGKLFEVSLKISKVEMSKRSYVTSKGKKTKLRVKGTKEKVVWTSSNSGAVRVSSDGTIRCRKNGNAVITAALGDIRVGCAVSVVSPKLLKVIKTAKKIGANWKYSQPKRMQTGYYDCSSLVWKSYKKVKKTFGLSGYAPVAADEAKWCAHHGKRISKSYTRNHIQKMKLRPGDLMFETGAKNNRYKGIYHVEMFVGYAVAYYDDAGKPVINELWAARPEGYYGGGHPIYRP